MKQRHPLFLFAVTICAAFLVFTVQYSVRAITLSMFHTNAGYAAGTAVGSLPLTGLVREQAEARIGEGTAAWQKEPQLRLTYSTADIALPGSLFQFDAAASAARITERVNRAAVVQVQSEQLRTVLQEQLQEDVLKHIDIQQLEQRLKVLAGQLARNEQIQLSSYLKEQDAGKVVAAGSIPVPASDMAALQQWVQQHQTVAVPARGTVALSTLAKGSEDRTLSMIATLIYETILPTNFQVQQRAISMTLPVYAELGAEAHVEQGASDFIFVNPNTTPYTLRFTMQDGTATAALEGLPLPYRYELNRSEVTVLPKRTMTQTVLAGSEHDAVTAERTGQDGYEVKVMREVYGGNGALLQKQEVADDVYLPVQAVEHMETVSQQATTTN